MSFLMSFEKICSDFKRECSPFYNSYGLRIYLTSLQSLTCLIQKKTNLYASEMAVTRCNIDQRKCQQYSKFVFRNTRRWMFWGQRLHLFLFSIWPHRLNTLSEETDEGYVLLVVLLLSLRIQSIPILLTWFVQGKDKLLEHQGCYYIFSW